MELIGKQAVPAAHTPLSLSAGSVGCRLKNGALDNILLDTHRALNAGDAIAKAQPQRRCGWCLLPFWIDCAATERQPLLRVFLLL